MSSFLRRHSYTLQQNLPNAQLVIYPDANHGFVLPVSGTLCRADKSVPQFDVAGRHPSVSGERLSFPSVLNRKKRADYRRYDQLVPRCTKSWATPRRLSSPLRRPVHRSAVVKALKPCLEGADPLAEASVPPASLLLSARRRIPLH